ncbi:MAG: endonuclease/exonuclease/phosphatase family protein [Rikenellaceae bacterium]
MYYNSPKRRKGFFAKVATSVMFMLTMACAVLLVVIYWGSSVNPNDFWPFAFLTLGMPIVMIINFLLILYWIFRWKLIVVIPLVAMLIGINNISAFYKPSFSKDYNNDVPRNAIKIVSYNVGGFFNMEKDGRMVSIVDTATSFVKSLEPDIICFQEYEANYKNSKYEIDSLLGDWKYSQTFYTMASDDGVNGWGLAVYSKYPILKHGGIEYLSNNGSMWVDLLVGKDTVHLFNNHLQSMCISREEKGMFDPVQDKEHMAKEKIRGLVYKMRENFRLRANQADTMATIISKYDNRVIVCGDFNDTPLSYTYRTMRGNLLDTFIESGSGLVNTYRDLFGIFRIDYVLHSKDISSINFEVIDNGLSDHKAVKSTVLLN